MRKFLILGPILLVLAVAGAGKFRSVREDLTAQREAMDAEWTEVSQVLDQRADLAPQLADVVKSYARKDAEVFREIAESRNALADARIPEMALQANARLSHALWSLMALSEEYAPLRSNPDFLRLQDELAGIENSIAVERQKYNETLEHYNAQLQRFPDNIVASLSGFARNDAYFRTDVAGRSKPRG